VDLTAPLLRLQNIEACYGAVAAVRGVSLAVPEGAIVALLGANGAGKTTVLRIIAGAMDPRQGTVSFAGREIQGRDPDWVARQGIAHVPEGRELFPLLTVRDNLRLGAYRRHDRAAIAQDLERVYGYFPVLRERAKQRAGYLSGGEQQMLAIGRALMARPRLMLLDEPSLGLSPLLVMEIFDIIRRLNQTEQVAMLLVEQNAYLALQVVQHGYVMEAGRIVLDASPERLLGSGAIQQWYRGAKQ